MKLKQSTWLSSIKVVNDVVLLEFPKEILELMEIYKPYMERHGNLSKDAPKEAVEARKTVKKWAFELGQ
jgi:hypothetical protein